MRREKISERMKLLQALVPGCDKVKFDSTIDLTLSFYHKILVLCMLTVSCGLVEK